LRTRTKNEKWLKNDRFCPEFTDQKVRWKIFVRENFENKFLWVSFLVCEFRAKPVIFRPLFIFVRVRNF